MNDIIARQLQVTIDILIESIGKLNLLLEEQAINVREEILTRWKQTNPQLAKKCGAAAKVLAEAYNGLLEEVVEATENPDQFLNTFTMHEFIDRFGLKLIHFNTMIHLLTQLGK